MDGRNLAVGAQGQAYHHHGEEELKLDIEVGRVTGGALVADYVAGAPAARAFYAGWWGDPDAYRAKALEVDGRFGRAERERAALAMVAPTGAEERLSDWVERGGYLVTTGQQPVLFTGPLYTVYKALTAVRLASALEDHLDAPVLPLFWVASEDHDWEESNHTGVIDVENELRRVEVAAPAEELGRPLHRIHPGGELERARAELLAHLPTSDFSPPLAALLERAYRPGHTLPEAFARTLLGLLQPFGLFLVDAAHPVVKEASLAVLERELDHAEEHERVLTERARQLEAAGYHVQVPVLAGGVNLFVEGPAGRERLYRDDGSFHLRHSGARLTREELGRRLREEPGTVSPNVLLRPVVESHVFPTLSLVGGPAESAYLGQLQPYFEAHAIRPPVIHPRFGATVIEGKVGKVLEKFALAPEELRRPFHEVAAAVAESELPGGVRRALGEIRGALAKGTSSLIEAARAVDPTLKGPIEHARGAALDALADAERKILQAVKRENEVALGQLEKARLHLFPEGKPQERVLSPFYYLFRYGPAFLTAVADRFDPPFLGATEAAPRLDATTGGR